MNGQAVLRIDVVTVFPDYLAPLQLSLVGRAIRAGVVDITVHDLRTWTDDRHRTVDDAPYGGGPGMLMQPEPWGRALDALVPGPTAASPPGTLLIVPTPAGVPLTQAQAQHLASQRHLVVACGRYEGIDARVAQAAAARMPVVELSVGDVVLAGGEAAALVMIEAVVRLLPGVLGNPASLAEESHAEGLLEYPGYTRPEVWRGLTVPPVLRSGDHARIRRWRRDESLRRTVQRRPDLVSRLDPATLDAADVAVLATLGWVVDEHGVRPGPTPVAH
jgi:tRNA (guanine37-N1)-methyltransferase